MIYCSFELGDILNDSNVFDIAVVGSGIGGTLIGALNQHKNIILFEKDSNLGGCASTFKRFGHWYNAGATTFVGYEKGHCLKSQLDAIRITPNIIESKIAFRVIQEEKIIDRTNDFESFLQQMQQHYPNANNRFFWETIKHLDEQFWQLNTLYFSKRDLKSYLKTTLSFIRLLWIFKSKLFKSAQQFVHETLGDISKEYEAFINAQLFITVQSTYDKIPLLSMALGLSYPFHKTYYVNEGMGALINQIAQKINVHKNEEIIAIKKEKGVYRLISKKGEYFAHNIILNKPVALCGSLFEDKQIKSYFNSFSLSKQSAFVVYMKIKNSEEFLHHYQIILKENIPNAISNSFFISFSNKEDEKLSKDGYSVTISTHTNLEFWERLSKEEYEYSKMQTQNHIFEAFLNHFSTIEESQIKECFSATPKTFQSFIARANCGGNPITFENILNLPTCSTPFKGLYNVGDTLFCGQGWPGISIGVEVLNQELND